VKNALIILLVAVMGCRTAVNYTNAPCSIKVLNERLCIRCNTPTTLKNLHIIWFQEYLGCFALCFSCWEGASIEERILYYHELVIDVWDKPDLWYDIEQAIMDGK